MKIVIETERLRRRYPPRRSTSNDDMVDDRDAEELAGRLERTSHGHVALGARGIANLHAVRRQRLRVHLEWHAPPDLLRGSAVVGRPHNARTRQCGPCRSLRFFACSVTFSGVALLRVGSLCDMVFTAAVRQLGRVPTIDTMRRDSSGREPQVAPTA